MTPDPQPTFTYRGNLYESDRGEAMNLLFLGCALGNEGHLEATAPRYEYGRQISDGRRCPACGQGYWDAPLGSVLKEDIEDHGQYLTVRYGTGAEPITDLDGLAILTGEGFARCDDFYTEITGYCFTNEDIEVGGHDLLAELRQALEAGRPHLTLEVRFSKEPAEVVAVRERVE